MDEPYEEDESWNIFIHQYYWVLVLLVILAFLLVGVLLWYIRHCRREPRYDYSALADESFLQERLEMDRKLFKDSDRSQLKIQREIPRNFCRKKNRFGVHLCPPSCHGGQRYMATICCQYYLRGSNRYIFLQHLPDMGSRIGKNWYLVRDSTTKTERLLTMTPVAETCPIKYNSQAKQVLHELFLAIQHPYIYPVLDIDRKVIMEQEYVITVVPFNEEGTLKDLIYQSQCQDDWKDKYHFHGYGLGAAQIQRLGCQILEALLFLKDQKFPTFLHLHSGNVIIQNGVARISGLENTLFGYSSRFLSVVPKRLQDNKESVEVLLFGQLIFEMASGYELTTCHPTEKNFKDIEHLSCVVDVLKFVFEQGRYRYPTLRQIASLEFFRHIDLRELRSLMPVPSIKTRLSSAALSLLKDVKRSQRSRRNSKYFEPVLSVDSTSVASSKSGQSSTNGERSHRRKSKTSCQLDDGQLMKTLPISEAENSDACSSQDNPGEEENNPQTEESQGDSLAHARSLLLQDIKKGVLLRKTSFK